MTSSPPIVCVAGAQPAVGKTVVAAGLVRRARALGGHPVGTIPLSIGCPHGEDHDLISADGEVLRAARDLPLPPLVAAPYRFATRSQPLLAARRAGLSLSLDDLAEGVHTAAEHGDVVIVELPAGALDPIAEDGSGLDLARRLEARVLVVDSLEPGVVGRVSSVLECARNRSLEVGGVLLNARRAGATEKNEIEALLAEVGGARVFPTLPTLEEAPIDGATTHLSQHAILEGVFRR